MAFWISLLTVALTSTPALAKPPTLAGLFPAGANRGATVEVTARGDFERWPVRAWVEAPGVTVEPLAEKGKLRITVAADAPIGPTWVRLLDDEGASAPRPFVVGTLPEVVEAEPNDDPRKPQALDGSAVVVNGRLAKSGDVDGFAVMLKRGDRLVAALAAHRVLGSPMDGVIQVANPEGIVLAQEDDDGGLDPLLVFAAPADGRYIVRLFAFPATPDSSIRFAGGEAFVYRLTLTTRGYLDAAFPAAVRRSAASSAEAIGWNIPEGAGRLAATQAGDEVVRFASPDLAGWAEVRIVDGPAPVEAEPNGPEAPQAVERPVVLSGRIEPAGDRDTFRFSAAKGETIRARIEARSLGRPLDPVLRLADAAGKSLAEADDSGGGRDAELSFTATADGPHQITVSDLHGRGGPRFLYRLTLTTGPADFSLRLPADSFVVAPGKPLEIKVEVDRKPGFDGPIEVAALDLPEGVSAAPVASDPKGPTAKAVTLRLEASGALGSGPFRVVGRPNGGEAPGRAARITLQGFDAPTVAPWLTVRKAPEAQ